MIPLVDPGPPLSHEQLTRYARHLLMPSVGDLGQRRLLSSRVAVVGAGGLGSPVIQYLAAAGVGELVVIDDDVVDATNLQRQVIHDLDAVGLSKAESAASRVETLNPDVRVTIVRERLTTTNAAQLLSGAHVAVDGSDNFDTRYAVTDACAELGMPYVWASVLQTQAQVSTFWRDAPVTEDGVEGTDLRDLFPHPPAPATVQACGDAGVLGVLTGLVGSLMAAEVVKLVTGEGEPLLGRVLFVDGLATRFREIPLRRNAARSNGADDTTRRAPAPTPAPPLPRIEVEALAALLSAPADAGDPATPVVLDVREASETAFGVVPGALLVPVGEVEAADTLASLPLPTDRPVVVTCKGGGRAPRAAAALVALGHPDVRVLDGGMTAWRERIDPTLPAY